MESFEEHNGQELLTIGDLAKLLKISKSTVYSWRHQGRTPPALKVGRHVRFRYADVQRWLIGNEDTAA
jgi:excisionase family DNA binding protein